MRATSANHLIRSQLDAGSRDASRYVDLQLELRRYKSGTPIARFGGRWDRARKAYAGDASKSRVLEVHCAQITAVERFDSWLTDHLEGGATELDDRVREIVEGNLELDAASATMIGLRELIFSGGRRSGKTTIMEALLTAYVLAVPNAIAWTVVPSEQFRDEPKSVLEEIMPTAWARWRGDPNFRFDLANGSVHHLRSGTKAQSLKRGRASIIGANEASQIPAASYLAARAATADTAGISIVATNPPTTGDVGTWVADAVHAISNGTRPGAEHIFVDPLDNPHVDKVALLALRSSMSDHDWQTQIRGKFLEAPDSVLYSWDRAKNERPPPDFGETTSAFLTAHEGDHVPWAHLVVIDIQSFPWIAAGIFRVFRDPDSSDDKSGLIWMTDEIALPQADEQDCADELKRRGIDGSRTLMIVDASAFWQQAQRDPLRQRPMFTGKGSADIFKRNGFPHVVRPDRSMKANPDVLERVRCTNAVIKGADGIPHLFIDPVKCPNAVDSARKWRMTRNKPSRTAKQAHYGDVLGYLCWRYFPRRGSAAKLLESEGIHRERSDEILDLERERRS